MRFRPIDELSLRHLFSTGYAQEILRMSYLGPVLSSIGTIETSPDCIVLDMRSHPFKSLRCEFKFIPSGKNDFSHNGRFDIAIVWELRKGVSKERLLDDLREQNGCEEIIVLSDMKAFSELLPYEGVTRLQISSSDIVRKIAINRDFPQVFALCMAANLFPKCFQMDKMLKLLTERFPSVQKMLPQGRANVVSAFLQKATSY